MDIDKYEYWAGDWHFDEQQRRYEEDYGYRSLPREEVDSIEFHVWADCQIDGWDNDKKFTPGWCKEASNRDYRVNKINPYLWCSICPPNRGENTDYHHARYRIKERGKLPKMIERNRSRKEKYIYRNGAGDADISGSFLFFT